MAGRLKINLEIDSRTDGLTDEALLCRTFGHRWQRRSSSRSRTLELLAVGCTEYFRYCENGCGSTWRQIYSFRERAIVEQERYYPGGGQYLLPKNSGRLSRNDAREAQFVREHPDLVK